MPTGVETFFDNLRKSGLFSGKTIRGLMEEFAHTQNGEELAHALVKAGRLTRFQADSVLAGKVKALLLGQYVILGQIGKGGLGRVYKAMHRTMNRVVAIKILAPNLLKTDKAKQLFQREVLATAKFHHPNIVTAYDACTQGGHYYLVMEYVPGPNLEELVIKRGPLRPSLACEIIRQAATGLQYACDMDMLHRDIKPANILIHGGTGKSNKSFVVKLVDFGLARLQSPGNDANETAGTILLRQNTVMGTPDFISPEQARNMHGVDIRSDLYSLGCTFYFLLTGKVLFPGGTALEKLIRHSQEEPDCLDALGSDVPPEVVAILRKLLAKDPSERFQKPADLIQALTALSAPGTGSSGTLRAMLPYDAIAEAEEQEQGISDSRGDFKIPADEPSSMQRTWPPDATPTPLPSDPDIQHAIQIINEHKRKQKLSLVLLLGSGVIISLIVLLSYLMAKLVH